MLLCCLQDAASMLQRIQAATKGRPSPSAVGVRAWPVRKVAALQEVCVSLEFPWRI